MDWITTEKSNNVKNIKPLFDDWEREKPNNFHSSRITSNKEYNYSMNEENRHVFVILIF